LSARPADFVRVDTSTYREPSAFKQNTGYTTRGRGAGGGTVAGASVLAQAVCKQAVRKQAVRKQAVRRHQAEVAAPK